jgi:two-component system chemotaxis response regulator CheB
MAIATERARGRILVADDSGFMRRILVGALTKEGFDVVGEAADGDETLAQVRRLRPDAITLDLAMPGTDGMEVLRQLRSLPTPPPAVVVSAFSPAHGARAVDALAEGAFDLAAKPVIGEPFEAFAADLAAKLDAAAHAAPRRSAPRVPAARPAVARGTGSRIVVIACSTGGPKALGELVPQLPAPLGAGTLIVQHMPPGFTGLLAQRLDKASPLTVKEAAGGEVVDARTALVAPGGRHLRLAHDRTVELGDDSKIGGVCPRADLTIEDAARLYGRRMLLVVLTGMGKDGLTGAEAVHRAGGRVLVEDASTCTVYGMPRAVAEAGLAHAAVPLPEMAAAIAQEVAR